MVKTGAVTAAAALAPTWLSTAVLETYGWTLFLGLPFVIGLVAARVHARDVPRTLGECFGAAVVASLLASVAAIAIALEGAICIVLALPILLPLALLGAYVGYLLQRDRRGVQSVAAVALLLPAGMGVEAGADRPPAARAVTTSVVVDAPPEVVWRHVVAFPPLPAPRDVVFRAGIAYPTSATISGRGAGAVRRCRFSTGDFVEPVTAWEPPRRLAFEVAAQPAPMRELSPWGGIHPPHLDGFLRSRRGEFRLVRLPGGRTRLTGTTWYENRMWPARYWAVWSDALIHRIHRRVLDHVALHAERTEARRERTRAAAVREVPA